MHLKTLLVLILFCGYVFCDAQQSLEARGKKKKKHIGLWVYFADIVVKKVFVLKLIYAFVLWCVVHKAGYFLAWFIGYLKEKKHEEHDHHHHHHSLPPSSYSSYGPYRKSYKIKDRVSRDKAVSPSLAGMYG